MSESGVLYNLCDSYCDLRWHLDPVEGSNAGAAGCDARLGSFGDEHVRQHLAGLRALIAAVEETDVDSLDVEIDRTALLDHMRVTDHQWRVERPHVRDPGLWVAQGLQGLQQLLLLRAPSPARRDALLARLTALPALLADAQATLAGCPTVLVESALMSLEAGAALVEEAAAAAGGGDGVPLQAGDAARAALEAFAGHLRSLLKGGPPREPWGIGRDALLFRLRHQHAIAAGTDDLLHYVAELIESTDRELSAVARKLGRDRWQDVLADLQSDMLGADEIVPAHEAAVARARRHLEEHPVLTCRDGTLDILSTPAFARPWIPVAAYLPPAPLADDRRGRLFVTARAGAADPWRARAEVAVAIAHEAFPGHHLQFVTAQAQTSPVRRLLYSPAAVEGWALYAEGLMDETGFYADDLERFCRLLALYRRGLRVALDVGVHTGSLTWEAAVRFARDRMVLGPAQAAAEVHRAYAVPAYQLAYAAGYREITALRADAGVTAEADLRAFHDRVLSYGGLPWALIRWGMNNEPA